MKEFTASLIFFFLIHRYFDIPDFNYRYMWYFWFDVLSSTYKLFHDFIMRRWREYFFFPRKYRYKRGYLEIVFPRM